MYKTTDASMLTSRKCSVCQVVRYNMVIELLLFADAQNDSSRVKHFTMYSSREMEPQISCTAVLALSTPDNGLLIDMHT